MGAIGTLRFAIIIGLVSLTECVQMVANAPSANAPLECSNLVAEHSRRAFAYNVEVQAIRAERARTGNICPEASRIRQRITKMSAIIAVSDQMNAKGCYQQPNGEEYNRNVVSRLNAELARCEAQSAATLRS